MSIRYWLRGGALAGLLALSAPLVAQQINYGPGVSAGSTTFTQLIPRGYFSGLKVTKTAAQVASIASGTASNSTDASLLVRDTACTVTLTVSGAGGLDSGAVAATTWYALFLVSDGAPGGATSCVATATTAAVVPATPTLPATYTAWAYVGRFKTDAGSNIDDKTILPRGQFYIDASGTYTPGASGFTPGSVRLLACGGGGSGGSGGRQVSGSAISGGAGGSGGGCFQALYPISVLPATLAVTVGAGGAEVLDDDTNTTAGTTGNTGAPTFFGATAATAWAHGGKGCTGSGGQLAANSASGGSGGGLKASNTVSACTDGAGSTAGAAQTGGAAGVAGAAGASISTEGFGTAGGGALTAGTAASGGFSVGRFGCSGGGSGGGVTTAPASNNGGFGGFSADSGLARTTAGTVGTPAGAAGAIGDVTHPGNAGAGGYGNSAGAGGDGGAGAQCSGGGGGGSVLNDSVAGKGGAGGSGYAFVWEMQ